MSTVNFALGPWFVDALVGPYEDYRRRRSRAGPETDTRRDFVIMLNAVSRRLTRIGDG
jgi:hypothetical protein